MVAKVVRRLFVIVGVLLAVVVVLSLIRHVPLTEMIPLMLVLLMSAVPVALPVMFTVSMAFVAIAFVATGKFVVSAFAMLLLVFMTDFAKIALATDHVRPSRKPETWNIEGFITVSVALGVAMVAETLLLLWIGWSRFGLAANDNALYTFSFLTLLYFAAFSIVSARERRWFFSTMPSKTLLGAIIADVITGTVLTFVGLPGLLPLPWWQTLAIFAYAMVSCLVVNDAVKVAMIKWLVPTAAA